MEARELAARQREELNVLESNLKEKYSDFDMKKVTTFLKEIDKKSPGRGDMLFNAEGIELIWKSEFMNANNDDKFDTTNGSGGISKDETELIEKIKQDTANVDDELRLWSRFA